MRRVRWVLALAAATALVASACTSNEGGGATDGNAQTQEPVTLDFWLFEAGDLSGSVLDQIKQRFEAANPNVDLNITLYPEENYGVKLDTAIAAGKTPDLVLVYGPEQMRAGLLLPLDDMVAEHGIDLSTYVPSIVQPGDEFSCAYEDHLYCLGTYAGSVQLIYNKDMFDAAGIPYPAPWPPMTPEEFIETACQLTDEEKGVWGTTADGPLAYLPYETFFSDDGRTAEFNSPEAVHQVEVLASGYERGCIPSSNVLDPWNTDYLISGNLAMLINGFQDLNRIEKAGINYGTTGSPSPVGEEPYFFVWTDSVGVMSSSEHPDEAMDFIAFLTTEGQRIRYEVAGDMPLDLAIAEEVNWAGGIPGREDGIEVLSHARPAIFIPNRGDVMGPFDDAWGFVVAGEKSAQEALDDANPAIQENLDKAWSDWEEQG